MVGSSRRSTSGWRSSSFASAKRICHPPENSAVVARQVGLLEAEPEEHRTRLGLERVAAECLEPLVQPPVLAEKTLLLLALLAGGELLLQQPEAVFDARSRAPLR